MPLNHTVNLGDKVRDTINGLTGVAVIKSYHLNGCCQITIEAMDRTDDRKRVIDTVDIARVEVIEAGAFQPKDYVEAAAPGGPSRVELRP